MPLVYSPLSEEVLGLPPKGLFPRCAFIMRQLGTPPDIDLKMTSIITQACADRGIAVKDADASTGAKDFLERIFGLIRGTGFTIAIFSHQTRPTAMANIALELGFAAMCGKPLLIVKSKDAVAPSDLSRTDWIVFDEENEVEFGRKITQALNMIDDAVSYEEMLLDLALEAPLMDCAVALERALKAFLLSGDVRFIDKAELVKQRLDEASVEGIADLQRVSGEIFAFIRQARRVALPA